MHCGWNPIERGEVLRIERRRWTRLGPAEYPVQGVQERNLSKEIALQAAATGGGQQEIAPPASTSALPDPSECPSR